MSLKWRINDRFNSSWCKEGWKVLEVEDSGLKLEHVEQKYKEFSSTLWHSEWCRTYTSLRYKKRKSIIKHTRFINL